MAGDWIPLRTDLLEDPAVVGIALMCCLDEFSVVGRLVRIWSAAQAHSEDGTLPFFTAQTVDKLASCDGFANAMVRAGWLVLDGDGAVIPKFGQWLGNGAKRRLKDKERKNSVRKMSAKKADVLRTTGQERREKKKDPLPPKVEVEIPDILRSEDFGKAWERWKSYKRETRKPLKPSTEAAQLKKLAGWGLVRAVAAIDHTISNGWIGLFEPDAPRTSGGRESVSSRKVPDSAETKRFLDEATR